MKATRYCVFALALAFSAEAEAQFLGHNFPGDFGMFSGSQPPPGRYTGVYVVSHNSTLKQDGGAALEGPSDDSINLWAVAPFFTYVSNTRILGGQYGFVAAVAFANADIEFPRVDVALDQFAITDTYMIPFQLGWHWERTDVTASYGFFAPTGKYEAGASDNIGLGMWSHELSVGFTRFLGEGRAWSVACRAFYEIHSKKRDVDIRAGDLLVLEGGLGKTFASGSTVGAAYHATWQTTNASGTDVPMEFLGRKIRVFGLGPELGLWQGRFSIRALWEFGVRNSLEGFVVVANVSLPF